MPATGSPEPRRHRVLAAASLLIFVALCAWPMLGWMRDPSLFDDDFARVGSLRRSTPATSLLRPFNEHLAPLFELTSWLAWWGAGCRVDRIATSFLIASMVATLATLLALGAVVRLEMRSTLAGLVAVAGLCLSSVAAETVLWYSASSFEWAAATSLAAWFAAVRAIRSPTARGRGGWLVASALMSAVSPCFSAIGALAGPLASSRIVLGAADLPRFRTRWSAALIPLVGTVGYALLLLANPAHGEAVSASVRRHSDLAAAGWAVVRAPTLVLLPSLVGWSPPSDWMPDPLAALVTVTLWIGIACWAWIDRPRRGLLLVGLGWLVAGYTLAYLARAEPGDRWILAVGRYHLFPLVGVVGWVAAGLGPLLDRLEVRRPLAGWVGLIGLAAGGVLLQGPRMSAVASQSFRYPDQGRIIASALRLEAICHDLNIPFDQVVRIIDPIEARWFPRRLPFHPLLCLFGPGPGIARWTDPEARARLLARLTPDDREWIFGGIEARADAPSDTGTTRGLRPIRLEAFEQGVTSQVGEGRLFYESFAIPPAAGAIEALELSGVTPGTKVEIWWAAADSTWSPRRSARLRVASRAAWIDLTSLPHWRDQVARRFRVVRRGRPLASADHPTLILECRTVPF